MIGNRPLSIGEGCDRCGRRLGVQSGIIRETQQGPVLFVCRPCQREHYKGNRERRELRDGMRALARFMVWVECEAGAESDRRNHEYMDGGEREDRFINAIRAGKFRLDWPEAGG